MNITPTSSSPSSATGAATSRPPRPPGGGEGGAFAVAATALGMTAEEVATRVQGGTSLLDLAEEKGVSSEDLLTALEEGAPEGLRSAGNLREIVTRIASETGGPGGPGGAGGPGGPPPGPPPAGGVMGGGSLNAEQESVLSTLSDLLDMSTEDLTTSLTSGTTLASLLTDKGIDLDTLGAALSAALGDSLHSDFSSGTVVDLRC